MRLVVPVVMVGLLVIVGCAADGPPGATTSAPPPTSAPPTTSAPAPDPLPAGDHELTIDHDGRTREYILHVPDRLAEVPGLLVVLHGGAQNNRIAALMGYSALADTDGYLVAYPNAVGGSWNDGRDTDFSEAHRDDIDDAGFVLAMIDEISDRFGLDPAVVWVTGASNGGMMTHRLLCESPDRFAGGAMVIAQPPATMTDCIGSPAVNVLVMNGTLDPLMPFDGGQVIGGRGEVIGTDETMRLWSELNGCDPVPALEELTPLDEADPTRVEVETYAGCAVGGETVLYRIVGGGHGMPGGIQYLPVETIGPISPQLAGVATIYDFLVSRRR